MLTLSFPQDWHTIPIRVHSCHSWPQPNRKDPATPLNLIITADDFGRSHEINAAVLEAHRHGILTHASLMVAGEAADEAAAIARANPSLAVGLHVVTVDGPAILPPSKIPRLVDPATGRFPDAPTKLGLRYYFSRAARRELEAEITAQFERFATFGLPLSHVDGHQHMHLHPSVWPIVLRLARQHGARRIRVVRDELQFAMRFDHSQWMQRLAWKLSFAALGRRARREAREAGLEVPDRVYGLMRTGRMTEPYVLALLERLNVSASNDSADLTAEIYFHPTTGSRTDAFGPNPEELETLVSPKVREAIRSSAHVAERSGSLSPVRRGEG